MSYRGIVDATAPPVDTKVIGEALDNALPIRVDLQLLELLREIKAELEHIAFHVCDALDSEDDCHDTEH